MKTLRPLLLLAGLAGLHRGRDLPRLCLPPAVDFAPSPPPVYCAPRPSHGPRAHGYRPHRGWQGACHEPAFIAVTSP
jgi:hypothetical protein